MSSSGGSDLVICAVNFEHSVRILYLFTATFDRSVRTAKTILKFRLAYYRPNSNIQLQFIIGLTDIVH